MNYQHTENDTIKTYTQLQLDNLGVSLAPDGTEILLTFWHVITPTDRPAYDVYTQGVQEIAPVNYVQAWEIFPLDTMTINENIAQAKASKYSESDAYAVSLTDEANANPFQGSYTTAAKHKRRMGNRVNGSSNGKPKSQDERRRDGALEDYSTDTYDAQDNCDAVIDSGTDAQAIPDLDVTTIVTWPTWTPPA